MERHSCSFSGCNATFSAKKRLQEHARRHSAAEYKPHPCPDCHATFAHANALARHARTHSGDRPYKCPYKFCDAAFIHSSALTTHIHTHTGQRPFQCTFPGCISAFAHPSNLTTHMRIHTREKPYICTEPGCSARFAQSSNLTRHMRTHTKEKPYVCSSCPAAFASLRSLGKHSVKHTNNNDMQGMNVVDHDDEDSTSEDEHFYNHQDFVRKDTWRQSYSQEQPTSDNSAPYPYQPEPSRHNELEMSAWKVPSYIKASSPIPIASGHGRDKYQRTSSAPRWTAQSFSYSPYEHQHIVPQAGAGASSLESEGDFGDHGVGVSLTSQEGSWGRYYQHGPPTVKRVSADTAISTTPIMTATSPVLGSGTGGDEGYRSDLDDDKFEAASALLSFMHGSAHMMK